LKNKRNREGNVEKEGNRRNQEKQSKENRNQKEGITERNEAGLISTIGVRVVARSAHGGITAHIGGRGTIAAGGTVATLGRRSTIARSAIALRRRRSTIRRTRSTIRRTRSTIRRTGSAVGLRLTVARLTIRLRGLAITRLAVGLLSLRRALVVGTIRLRLTTASRDLATVGSTRKNLVFIDTTTTLVESLTREFVSVLVNEYITVNLTGLAVGSLDLLLLLLGGLAVDSVGTHASDGSTSTDQQGLAKSTITIGTERFAVGSVLLRGSTVSGYTTKILRES